MPRPTARVLALLEVLQSGGIHPAFELAESIGVGDRTIRRYVEHLLDLDIPIEAVQGRYGGYRIAAGYRMPPLMLTDAEALAIVLGLVAGQQAGLTSPSSSTTLSATSSAIDKLRRVLPRSLGAQLDAVLSAATFTATEREAANPDARVLLTLAEESIGRHPVEFAYVDRRDQMSARTVEPYGLVSHSGRWYLAAMDVDKQKLRSFRVDRIRHPRAAAGSFERPVDFDAAAFVLAGLATAPHAHDVSVLVNARLAQVRAEFPDQIAVVDELRTPPRLPASVLPLASALESQATEAWCRVRIQAEHLDWIVLALARLDCAFVIEKPSELRADVAAFAERLAGRASASANRN